MQKGSVSLEKTEKEGPLRAKQVDIFSDFFKLHVRIYFAVIFLQLFKKFDYFVSLSSRPKTKSIGSNVHI